jgi:hypothetical protein
MLNNRMDGQRVDGSNKMKTRIENKIKINKYFGDSLETDQA